jgi:hypothetical protein
MRPLLAHVVVILKHQAAALHHLRELQVHLRAQKLRNRQTRQNIERQLVLLLGPVQRRNLQLGQQRLPVGRIAPRLHGFVSQIPQPGRPLRGLRSFGGQQSFEFSVTGNQARDMRPCGFGKTHAEQHVVPQIIDADGESFERDVWRGSSQLRQRRLLRRSAQAKDGNAGHAGLISFGSC